MRNFLLSFCLFLNLFADPKDPYTLAVTEGDPSSLVEGLVSAITGDLYVAEQDTVIQGCVPLRLPRFYVSGNGEGKRAGWFFIDHLFVDYKGEEAHHSITIKDSNGACFTFQAPAHEVKEKFERKVYAKGHPKTIKFYPPEPSTTPGLTNTSQGQISAQTNLKNAYIKMDPDAEYFTLYCSDGTERIYRYEHHPKHFAKIFTGDVHKSLQYMLMSEKLPSGNMLYYDYDGHNHIKSIRTANPAGSKTYASATFEYFNKDFSKNPDFNILTSDGRKVQYRHNKHKKYLLLNKVITPESPEEEIGYHSDHDYCGPLVSRRSLPDNRYYDIDYYRPKHNDVGGVDIKLKSKDDFRCLRVKTLKAPVGTDSTPLLTHRFFYSPGENKTDVREIDNTLTRYSYSPQMRLDSIHRYSKDDKLTNIERFVWSPEGNILCRSFLDSSNKAFFARRFIYDDRGNVLEEKFYGNLSGQSFTPISFGNDGCPINTGAEVYVIKRSYSQDGRNLLLREEEPNGKITIYAYRPEGDLLTSKLIYDRNQIKIRHFYEYNVELVLVREITDDGSTLDKNNLTGVKTRRIKAITLFDKNPYVNMPHIIEEKYWDGNRETLLKKIILTYRTGGLIEKKEVYDANNNFCYSLKTAYDHLGRPREETNAIGQTAKFNYDIAGNMNFSQDSSGRRTIRLTHDYSNRLTQSEEIGFDDVKHITQHRYDRKHNKIATIDTFGNETRFVHDPFGHVIETHLSPVLDAEGNKINPILRASYDNAGREITRTDAKGFVTTTGYNSRSQVTSIQHPDGTQEKFIYNLDGTLRTHINQEGTLTSYTYDFLGRKASQTITSATGKLLAQETLVYDAFNLITKTDAEGYITTYTYDGAGRKISEEQKGERLNYAYDSLGRLHAVQIHDLLTFTEYDFLDRVIEERKENTSGLLLSLIKYDYNEAGNKKLIQHSVAGNQVEERFTYDSFNRLTSQKDPLNHEIITLYNEDHHNSLGQRVLQKTTIDPLNLHTIETYDAQNRLAIIEVKNSSDKQCSFEEKLYDPNGNLSRQVSTIFPAKRKVVTKWEYGVMNRLDSLTEAADSPEHKTTRYTYNKKGLLFKTFKPDGVVLEHNYNPIGDLISLTSSDGSISYTYSYNKLRHLLESKDLKTNTKTLRTPDHQGRVLQETLANGLIFKNSYDNQGRRFELTLPDNTQILYNHDALHLREVIRKDSSGFTLYTHLYKEYDLSDHLLAEEFIGNLGKSLFSIDSLGRTEALSTPYFSQQILERDPIGNIQEVATLSHTSKYYYDDLYQLTQETGLFTHTYTYDSHNNRLEKDNAQYQLNNLHQLSHFTYDLNGNPIKNADTRYTYDALDRLITLETPTLRLTFTYDSFHRRLSKTVHQYINNAWQETDHLFFLYDNQNEIGATDKSGAIIQLRVLGSTPKAEIGAAIAFELHGQIFAPIHDLFGNVASLISLHDHTQETYHYDAFGNKIILNQSTSSFHNPWYFSSKRTDEESGLIFYGRRYFDTSLGRWLTPDPQGFEDGPNLYAFVHNNPLFNHDLYGLITNLLPVSPDPIQTDWSGPKPVRQRSVVSKQLAAQPIILLPINIPHVGPPTICDLKGRREHPTIRFEWGNGINNSPEDAEKSATYLSDLLGGYNVNYVYNPTGGLVHDLLRWNDERRGIETPTITMLRQEWNNYFENSPPNNIILRVCHSEATPQTQLTLETMPEKYRKRIHVIAVAPAGFISKRLCASVVHLCNSDDLVPWVCAIPRAKKHGQMDSIAMVEPLNKDRGGEHDFTSRDYKEALVDVLNKNIKRKESQE